MKMKFGTHMNSSVLGLLRFDSVPHAGFGLGLERTVAWITGVEQVRETIPYPHMLNMMRP